MKNIDHFPSELFDPQAIARIQQLQQGYHPNILAQFVDLFLKGAVDLMHDFQKGVKSNDMTMVYYALRTLKSSSAHLGLTQFIELCTTLELAALRSELASIARDSKQLQIQFDEIEVVLMNYLVDEGYVETQL